MKHWIKKIYIYIFLGISLPAMAQENRPKETREQAAKRIEAIKAEFITRKLDLSPEEAQKFWPVYNSYQREMNNLFRTRREARRNQMEQGRPPQNELKFEGQILEVKKRYRNEFLTILASQKVDLLFQSEREFREHLINELRQRRQQNREK